MVRIVARAKNMAGLDPAKNIKHPTAGQYLAKVERFIKIHKPIYLLRAVFPGGPSVLAVEDFFSDWLIRVNRHYLGREWHTPALKYQGMVALTQIDTQAGNGVTVHLLIRPPAPASSEFPEIASKSYPIETEGSTLCASRVSVTSIKSSLTPREIAVTFCSLLRSVQTGNRAI